MTNKTNQMVIAGLFVILIVAVASFAYIGGTMTSKSSTPPPYDPTSLTSNSNGNSAGSGSGTSPTSDDSGSVATQPPQAPAAVTAEIWQALYIQTPQSVDNYWVQPAKAYLASGAVYGSPDMKTTDFSGISKFTNDIWIKFAGLGENGAVVQSWSLSCQETMVLESYATNAVLATIVNGKTVNAQGNTGADGVSLWAAGASESGNDFYNTVKSALNSSFKGNYDFFLVITLSNISLTVKYADGTSQTLTAPGTMNQNVLAWLINYQVTP